MTTVTRKPAPPVVVDASVLLATVLPDPQEHKDYAHAFLTSYGRGEISIVMTQLCQHEISAKLISKVRGGFVERAKVVEFLDLLAGLRWKLEVDLRPADALFYDSESLGCRGYDAAYLRAAKTYDAKFATVDTKLLPHMLKAGVKRWQP